jgi:hypothetical protein
VFERGRPVNRVHGLRDDRYAGEQAYLVGRGQELVARGGAVLPELHGLGAQHQVREVEVPLVRRHVRALAHVAHVAQVALVDDVLVLLLRDAIDLAGRPVVDKVEQRRERSAQADAASAPVADLEHALHFLLERLLVPELRALLAERMPGRRLEAALTDGHGVFRSD